MLSRAASNVYAARPLNCIYTIDGVDHHAADTQPSRAFIGAATIDSINKCQTFLSAITAGHATDNTILEGIAVTLSALEHFPA